MREVLTFFALCWHFLGGTFLAIFCRALCVDALQRPIEFVDHPLEW
jgi:hypothetical protein